MEEKIASGNCEDCLYFDYLDEETDDKECMLDLDEDEMEGLMMRKNTDCPYYRYFDEYKRVQKQN